ncbi:MAG: DUF1524 domain-containing protein [Bacteroidetes bacterium]|nr:DUF1524 domain-containing protein [Bacteroidota bacterium]
MSNILFFAIFLPISALAQQPLGNTFRGIQISPENRCSPYTSEDYPYSQSVEVEIIRQQSGIFSPYDMRCFVSRFQTDIEHIVARSEAHDSGLCASTAAVRKQFSEDLLNLTLATPALNRRDKIAKDVSEWVPPYNVCWYAHTIVEVKRKYGLTVDREEAMTLSEILKNCPEIEIIRPQCNDEMILSADDSGDPYSDSQNLPGSH